jgi:hypothetical protein
MVNNTKLMMTKNEATDRVGSVIWKRHRCHSILQSLTMIASDFLSVTPRVHKDPTIPIHTLPQHSKPIISAPSHHSLPPSSSDPSFNFDFKLYAL